MDSIANTNKRTEQVVTRITTYTDAKSSYCLLTLLRRSAAFAKVYSSTVLHVHVAGAVLKSQNNFPRMEHSQLKLKAYE